MAYALQPTDLSTAPQYLEGATKVFLRHRVLPGFLDEEGRIKRGAEGKDLNWLIDYKLPTAQDYTPGQPLSFANDNYHIPATVTPQWFYATSGMNLTEVVMNTGPVIVNNLFARGEKLTQSMQVKFADALYSDAAVTPNQFIGMNTFARRNVTDKVCTNADRIAVPLGGTGTYAGLNLAPGAYGGGWSTDTPNAQRMSTVLGSDWPDGHGTPDQMYDATVPKLYNERTNQWQTPGASPADSTWYNNCLAIISQANTDLTMNSVKTMMPSIFLQGSVRMGAVKNQMRVSFRDTMQSSKAAEMLGYYEAYNYEGAVIDVDHSCPSDRTFGVCAASMEVYFYGTAAGSDGKVAPGATGDSAVTGGVFTFWGPTMIPGTLDYAWMMLAGGNIRYNPKWITIIKDFTTGV
jgi:hypothetical protein